MVDLKNKWVLITGASRGIGYLSALFLAEQGCNLILHGRSKENLSQVYSQVTARGVEAKMVAAELSKLEEVKQMLDEIDAMDIPVDVVLNNAGLQIAYRTEYLETPASDYEASFMINTIAPMMITYHFIPQMVERGFGRIVNTTSGIDLDPYQAGYSASKAALNKVTRDLGSKYQGTDICINLADPGWCRTDLGGPQAPNAPESAIPGILVGAFIDDKKSGRIFPAQAFAGLSLEAAVKKAEAEFNSNYYVIA